MKIFGYKTPILLTIMWAFLAGSFFYALFSQDWSSVFVAGITIVISLYMIRLSETSDFHIPKSLLTAALVFIYATLFLGELNDFYEMFWWWDVVLHTGSAIGFGIIGFTVLVILFKQKKVAATPIVVSVFAFSVALAIGALWEIFEYAVDQTLGTNMQKNGLQDTMWDLIVDSIGAFIAATAGYFYLKKQDGPIDPIGAIIEEAVEENC